MPQILAATFDHPGLVLGDGVGQRRAMKHDLPRVACAVISPDVDVLGRRRAGLRIADERQIPVEAREQFSGQEVFQVIASVTNVMRQRHACLPFRNTQKRCKEMSGSLRRIAYHTWISPRSVGQELGLRNQVARLLHCLRLAKEQFAHRETQELLAMLDGVAAKTGSRGQVFEDWITMAVCALAGGTMEEEYLATVAKYTAGEKGKRPIDQLAAAFGRLVTIMEETREDILGDLFQGAITYGEHAQYFTPAPICDLVAQLTAGDEHRAGERISDPCCGSGRMLLAMAKVKPDGVFVGQDADLRCVKITAINLGLRNLYGYAIWGNSLTNERKLVYATGFNGKGVIRRITDDELPLVPIVEPPPLQAEPLQRMEPEGKTSQGSLFDGIE